MQKALPPGPAPSYTRAIEYAIGLLMPEEPERRLAVARRMREVFEHIEAEALETMEGRSGARR